MLVGVVSDTHDNLHSIRRIRQRFLEEKVEAVIHLGDFVAPFSFRELFRGFEGRGFAVTGNNDGELLILSRMAREMRIELKSHPFEVSLGGRRLLLLHGYGDPQTTTSYARLFLFSGGFDAVLFGHTHQFHVEWSGRGLLLNPGEGGGWLTGACTAALLDLKTMDVRRLEV